MGFTLPNLSYFGISGNRFTGTIPFSVSNMSNLAFLFIDGNKLIGKVPTFENLHDLRHIDISGNSLGSGNANDLSFISSLRNASGLQELGLSNNNFGGVLPDSFGNLSTKLVGLSVGNNQLFGSIPNWLSIFANFSYIDMSNNQFTGNIPHDIAKLAKIQRLDLSLNRFSGEIPSFLGNLSILTELRLDNNNFYGSIPSSLGKCQMLNALNISRNSLSGIIPPQVFGISSLALYLDLSHNQLTGSLPMEIGNMKNLGELIVAKNMLSGEIPSTLGSCVRLEKIYMEGNFFQGIIPSSLISLRGIQFLDVSCNNLSGQVPEYLGDFDLQYFNFSYNDFKGSLPTKGIFKNASAMSWIGNPKVCGGTPELQLPRCNFEQSKKITSTLTFKVIISMVSVILGLSLLLSFFVLYWYKKSKTVLSSYPQRKSNSKVSYQSLLQATDGFSSTNLIGMGGFGSVYKGILDDGTIIAVKVLNLSHRGATKSFKAECDALRNIRHRNLVKVLTACVGVDHQGNNFKALVYEFMANGNLEEWLHPNPKENRDDMVLKKLNLLQRLNIAIDVAGALEYLHRYCQTPLVHCDLKPSNVLLDSELVAHVSDFGLARFLPIATQKSSTNQTSSIVIRGSIGYTAPEYGMGSALSTYGDVYSFGMLLLEMFTGKKPTDDIFRDGFNLHNFVEVALPDRVAEIVDPILFQEIEEAQSLSGKKKSKLDE
ncbi:unnamed protein product [Ilex paraguariensis]|uniref:non-specific serine/threonine protein kinase n=1 Tax=Ilex paraguariensis TaxID=185542 RepID=A0ABC8SKZ8_9AQUA